MESDTRPGQRTDAEIFSATETMERERRTDTAEKAAALLKKVRKRHHCFCRRPNGYPRPVQMSKIKANGFNEVWTATGADSVKVSDFKHNSKAGLCYDCYGDSVALRGTVEIITDDAIRKEMWQDWFIHHFPGGPSDPNYVILHFKGTEATFWINGEFNHSTI